jgi:hypothetical protein
VYIILEEMIKKMAEHKCEKKVLLPIEENNIFSFVCDCEEKFEIDITKLSVEDQEKLLKIYAEGLSLISR